MGIVQVGYKLKSTTQEFAENMVGKDTVEAAMKGNGTKDIVRFFMVKEMPYTHIVMTAENKGLPYYSVTVMAPGVPDVFEWFRQEDFQDLFHAGIWNSNWTGLWKAKQILNAFWVD